ncbi:MAG TPA: hypothetical protein VMU08_08425 [Rhizomicrobium sp.]|nr:hypothetical protein [Rhizomicrobium sp.]
MRRTAFVLAGLIAFAGAAHAHDQRTPTAPPFREDSRPTIDKDNRRPPVIGDRIRDEMGLVDGKVQFFRYQFEGAPSNGATLNGGVNGSGVTLKLTW